MNVMRGILVLSGMLLSASASAQTIGGCITDSVGQPIPGATVSATAEGNRLTVLADGGGCYEFRGLSANSYRVTSQLTGFDNTTHDKIHVAAGQIRRLDFIMVVSPFCDCATPGTTLRDLADRVDAVVYLKITDRDNELSSPRQYFRQTAEVIEIVKDPPPVAPPFDSAAHALRDLLKRDPGTGPVRMAMTFLQDQSSGAPLPYEPGDEFVLFLKWWPAERILLAQTMHTRDRSDRDTVFVVENGLVTRTPSSLTRYAGVPVATLLADLRQVSQSK